MIGAGRPVGDSLKADMSVLISLGQVKVLQGKIRQGDFSIAKAYHSRDKIKQANRHM
jgi:hypothetical protein